MPQKKKIKNCFFGNFYGKLCKKLIIDPKTENYTHDKFHEVTIENMRGCLEKLKKVGVKNIFCPLKEFEENAFFVFMGTFRFHGENRERYPQMGTGQF